MEKLECSYIIDENMKYCSHFRTESSSFLNGWFGFDELAIPFPGIYPREYQEKLKPIYTKTCTGMSITRLFMIVKR